MNEDTVRRFIEEAKKTLSNYFREEIKRDDISLENVYPISISSHCIEEKKINNVHTELSDLYEQLIPSNIRKDYGRFYTNDNNVISSMLDECNVLSGKILEPACGTGLFLVQLVRRIVQLLEKNTYSSSGVLEYITNNVYGNDIDAKVLEIAEVNILAALMPTIVKAVKSDPSFKMSKIRLYNNDYTQRDCIREKFDLVIGNPPYVTLYGKRSRNMNEEKRAYYNTFDFVQNKSGNNKFNLCMFFVENGLKSLNPGGNLYYILDFSFFETAYIDLRKYIVENYRIESITQGLQEFDDVASGQILLRITNDRSMNENVMFTNKDKDTINYVNQAIWDNEKTKYKYAIPFNGLDKEINQKVRQFKRLDYYYPQKALRTCCALTGRTEDFIVNPETEKNFEVYPYIEGSKGLNQKFGVLSAQRYIKYDHDLQIKISDEFKKELELAGVKNKKRVTLGDKEVYDSPKIFIRQSAFEIISTYTEEPYAANNSIYVLSNKDYSEQGKKMLKYVCGILNSDLITYYCRSNNIIRAEKGKTPQIKTSDLKEVRICYDANYSEEIISLVDRLLAHDSKALDALNRLNKLVYQMYGINADEIEYIENYIASS